MEKHLGKCFCGQIQIEVTGAQKEWDTVIVRLVDLGQPPL